MLIYGHRGAQNEAPENTLAGFQHAIAIGLKAVEFDVQLAADGELVVFHDSTLDRTTNGSGEVAAHALAELRRLDARARFPDWPEPCPIPTLGEVLDVVGVLPHLLVEIKRDSPERLDIVAPAVIDHVRQRGLADRVNISSFDPYALDLVQRIAPDIPRTINGAWRDPHTMERAVAAGCTQADFDFNHTGPEHIAWAHTNGMAVIGWPCHTEADYIEMQRYDVDSVGSDAPTLIMRLMANPVR